MTKVPRWDRCCDAPQATLRGSGLGLRLLIGRPPIGWHVAGVLTVEPSHPSAQLFEVGISPVYQHCPYIATVSIEFASEDFNVFAEDELRQVTFGYLAEVLAALRRIDAIETNDPLALVCCEDSKGVAVSDRDYFAAEIERSRGAVTNEKRRDQTRQAGEPKRLFHGLCSASGRELTPITDRKVSQ